VLATLASLLLALPLTAAPVAEEAPTLEPGDRVRVTLAETPSRALVGALEARGEHDLTLRLDQHSRVVPADAILRVEVSRGRRPSTKWAVLGGLAGGAVGAFAGGCLANKDDYGVLCAGQDDTRYVIGGAAGGLVGGAVGAWLGRTERWEDVDFERRRSARREVLDRCTAARRVDTRGPLPMLDCQ
jgi:hypothetical protein